MAKSKWLPSLVKLAGAKLIVILLAGNAKAIELKAALIRSFDSETALSASPTILNVVNQS